MFSTLVFPGLSSQVQVLKVWGCTRLELKPFAPWGLVLGVCSFALGLDSFLTGLRSRGRGLWGACVPASSTCSDGGLLSFTQEFLEPALRSFYFYFFRGRVSRVTIDLVCLRSESGVPVLPSSSWSRLWFSTGSWEMTIWVMRRWRLCKCFFYCGCICYILQMIINTIELKYHLFYGLLARNFLNISSFRLSTLFGRFWC